MIYRNIFCKRVAAPIFAISRLRIGTDGPGVTSLVAFAGCPLRCKYCLNKQCHNSVYENHVVTERKGNMMLTPQELYDLVKVDNLYFQATGGGICFGGGEPTLYPTFLEEFKKLCGNRWQITIETCLRCSYNTIKQLNGVVDNWIVDIKSMDPFVYESYTGRKSAVVQHLESLHRLIPQEKVVIKVPHIPGYNDGIDLDNDIQNIKEQFGFTQVYKTGYRSIT